MIIRNSNSAIRLAQYSPPHWQEIHYLVPFDLHCIPPYLIQQYDWVGSLHYSLSISYVLLLIFRSVLYKMKGDHHHN